MAERKFLIVDDSATMRQLLIMAVRKLDGIGPLTLVEAVDGKDGFEKFQTAQFDLVMTDIKMPNMTGLELVGKLRDELGNRTVPIIIISTKGEESDIQRGLSLGANEYLLKPISTMRLKEVITKLLG
jgi:two-component system, chemotaxis family, chemotaxis protein CheY